MCIDNAFDEERSLTSSDNGDHPQAILERSKEGIGKMKASLEADRDRAKQMLAENRKNAETLEKEIRMYDTVLRGFYDLSAPKPVPEKGDPEFRPTLDSNMRNR